MDDSRRAPLDLPQLRLWPGYLIKNYDALASGGDIGYSPQEVDHYRACLVSLAQACEGQFGRPLKARIRELLALGVAGYGIAGGVPAGVPSAPDDQLWPATLTASPAVRPVVFEEVGGR